MSHCIHHQFNNNNILVCSSQLDTDFLIINFSMSSESKWLFQSQGLAHNPAICGHQRVCDVIISTTRPGLPSWHPCVPPESRWHGYFNCEA